jgi:predicted ATP-dependent protease
LARRQAVLNPENTISSAKRFIGRRYNEGQDEIKNVPFKVVSGPNNAVRFEIQGKPYAPEEIAAMVLRKLVADAATYLGEKITEAVITVPAGAIPKDGPSAGITMATALAAVYTGLPVRSDTAMTGEMTLTGLVLPIGGVKEKVLAARGADLHRVILLIGNAKDLHELPETVQVEMEFLFAECSEDVCVAAIPELAERLAITVAA